MHTFQAHDSAIKALALDPCEEYFTTGSAEGNIKVSKHGRWECVRCWFCCRLLGKRKHGPCTLKWRPYKAL